MNIQRETKLDERSEEWKELPFAPHLPQDRIGLLKFRLYVRQRCLHDHQFRADIWNMCARDVVFFIQVFGFFHETRGTEDYIGEFPALLDPDQQDILAWMQKWFGTMDITCEKTRGIGLSYIAGSFLVWAVIFFPHAIHMGVLSKGEKDLDQKDMPGSFMGKMDLFFKKLPAWGRMDRSGKTYLYRTVSDHKFVYKPTGSSVKGYVPNNDALRSDRLYCLVADEARFLPIEDQKWLAAAYGTVNSVMWISTHQGTSNLFYRLTKDEHSRLLRISTWWWNNRRCFRGAYRIKNNQIEIVDKTYKFPDGYFDQPFMFKLEKWIKGRLRSPWTDRYFTRPGIDPSSLLEELYGLSSIEDRRLLSKEVFEMANYTVAPPKAVGFIEDGEWYDDADGPIRFWGNPDRCDSVYVIGVDPGLKGTGGAYKAAIVIDCRSGEQIASARWINIDVTEFPKKVKELGQFLSKGRGFGYAKIAFESTGVGVVFKDGILRLQYPAICYEKDRKQPGFANNGREKEAWLLELGRAIREGDFIVRDEQIAQELPGFEWDDKLNLVYSLTDGHGDSAIAACLAWQGGRDRRRSYQKAQERSTNWELQQEEWAHTHRNWSDQFYN